MRMPIGSAWFGLRPSHLEPHGSAVAATSQPEVDHSRYVLICDDSQNSTYAYHSEAVCPATAPEASTARILAGAVTDDRQMDGREREYHVLGSAYATRPRRLNHGGYALVAGSQF